MSPAPKRRWFRFSLRTLFAVVTFWAIGLPFIAPLVSRIKEWWNQTRFAILIFLEKALMTFEEEDPFGLASPRPSHCSDTGLGAASIATCLCTIISAMARPDRITPQETEPAHHRA
jgi:hypothetical protein